MTGIIARAEWGAKHGNGFRDAPLPADEVWLHHSATIAPDLVAPFDDDFAAVRQLERIGAARFGGGISYTFVVTPIGLIFEGHGTARVGAHTKGHNTHGRGICLVGDYSERDLTPAQMESAVWLLREGVAQGWWKTAQLAGGHRDTKATECPGDRAYAAIGELNRRAAAAVAVPAPPTERPRSGAYPVLRFGDRSEAVVALQNFLRHAFPSYARFSATGYYGEQTKKAVQEFQWRDRVQGRPLDGTIVGPATNAALARYGYRP